MFGVTRRGMDFAKGAQIGANQTFVTVQGMLWIVRGDVNTPHGRRPHVPGGDNMAQGSSFVSIDGIPVCREGHKAGCGHATSGADWFKISD